MSGSTDNRSGARDRIMEATFTLIMEEGLGAATMTQIADQAGVARQTLYNHFSDVEQIVIAGIDEYDETGFAHLVELLDTSESPEAKIDLLVRHAVAAAAHGSSIADMRSALSPEARVHLDRHAQSFRSLIESIIAEGVAGGAFDPAIDPGIQAALIEGTLLSGADLASSRDDPARVATATSDAILRVLRAE